MDIVTRSIKRDHYDRMKSGSVIMIEATAAGYVIHQWSPDGVAPQSSHGTQAEAVARVAQLMRITSPVQPQNWPETVEIRGAQF